MSSTVRTFTRRCARISSRTRPTRRNSTGSSKNIGFRWRSPTESLPASRRASTRAKTSRKARETGRTKKSADQQIEIESFLDESEADDGGEEEEDTPGYSAEEVLRAKDFSNYTDGDVTRVRKLIAKIAPKIATKLSRRTKPDRDGPIVDLRRSMRSSLKYGGDILELARRERKRKKLKLVMVCDVSGSMDVYSRFLIQFIYGLQQEIKNVETFVFSTRLSRITELFKRKELTQALSAMSEQVADWSGGTSIGGALREFNEGPGKGLVDGRTVAMVISDGWGPGRSGGLGT